MFLPPILAFDCSTTPGSVALSVCGEIHEQLIQQRQQASELLPIINNLMNIHSIEFGDLSAIITTVGPGSFTGLRIALATLHGLALATNMPIKTITSLQAVAHEIYHRVAAGEPPREGGSEPMVRDSERSGERRDNKNNSPSQRGGPPPFTRTLCAPIKEFFVGLNAGKGEVFTQRFIGTEPAGEILLVQPEVALSQSLPCYGNIHPPEHAQFAAPRAATLCRIAESLPTTLLADALPLYIRPPDAKLPAHAPWVQTA